MFGKNENKKPDIKNLINNINGNRTWAVDDLKNKISSQVPDFRNDEI